MWGSPEHFLKLFVKQEWIYSVLWGHSLGDISQEMAKLRLLVFQSGLLPGEEFLVA